MKIGIAADHGAFELKETVAAQLKEAGYDVIDFGAYSYDKDDDFPDFVIPLSRAVSEKKVERGIAICGSGVGACIAAPINVAVIVKLKLPVAVGVPVIAPFAGLRFKPPGRAPLVTT